MIAWKSALARTARHVCCRFTSIRIPRSLERAISQTRAQSLDRAFLATKPGRFFDPPADSSGR